MNITLNQILIAIEQYLNNQYNLFEISGTVYSNKSLKYLSIDDNYNQMIYSIEYYPQYYRMIIWDYTNYNTVLDLHYPHNIQFENEFQLNLLYNNNELILINILQYINNILKPNNNTSTGIYDLKQMINTVRKIL